MHKMEQTQPTRRKQADRRQESETKILDTAEAIFAANGFNGTTMHEVAKAAGADTALLRYYFIDKEGLFDAVLQRRSHEVNAIRLEALDAYEALAGDTMTIEGIIEAFTRPAFTLIAADEGWQNYAAIVAYINSSRGALRQVMSANFDVASQRVITLMRRALPGADEHELYWGYHFFTGAFTFSIGQTGRIDVLSGGKVSSLDFEAICDRLIITLGAGIRELCARDAKTPIREDVERRRGPNGA
jgi:AcrR family transcriptional regulator